ncbi:hypothetical protein [Streptomyces viridosporus]|uniref:hypothetical protein n=1 Tax=Streptomyces viridosporus TaxID=67581 RepID=UPI00331A6B17
MKVWQGASGIGLPASGRRLPEAGGGEVDEGAGGPAEGGVTAVHDDEVVVEPRPQRSGVEPVGQPAGEAVDDAACRDRVGVSAGGDLQRGLDVLDLIWRRINSPPACLPRLKCACAPATG